MKSQSRISRRTFLLGATAGTAATAAAIVGHKASGPAAAPQNAEKSRTGSGYQLTEHVRNYYRTTRI